MYEYQGMGLIDFLVGWHSRSSFCRNVCSSANIRTCCSFKTRRADVRTRSTRWTRANLEHWKSSTGYHTTWLVFHSSIDWRRCWRFFDRLAMFLRRRRSWRQHFLAAIPSSRIIVWLLRFQSNVWAIALKSSRRIERFLRRSWCLFRTRSQFILGALSRPRRWTTQMRCVLGPRTILLLSWILDSRFQSATWPSHIPCVGRVCAISLTVPPSKKRISPKAHKTWIHGFLGHSQTGQNARCGPMLSSS